MLDRCDDYNNLYGAILECLEGRRASKRNLRTDARGQCTAVGLAPEAVVMCECMSEHV